jgi:hypothetical protein
MARQQLGAARLAPGDLIGRARPDGRLDSLGEIPDGAGPVSISTE